MKETINTYFISLYAIGKDSKFEAECLDYAGLERLENIENIIGNKEYLQEVLNEFGALEIRIRSLIYNQKSNTLNNKALSVIRAEQNKDIDITIYDENDLKDDLMNITLRLFDAVKNNIKELN